MVYFSVDDITNFNKSKKICICDRNSNKNILLIGTCRITAFLNYLANDSYFDSYNILAAFVHLPELAELSEELINNENFKLYINNTSILICEYVIHFKYFNTSRFTEKNIFKIKDTFDLIISLPNFQNPCIFAKDIIFHENLYEYFLKYINKEISEINFSEKLKTIHISEINRYCDVIKKSDFPEFHEFVLNNVYNFRIAHTINHPSNFLLIKLHEMLLKKFFNRDIPESVSLINKEYEFLDSVEYYTKLTLYDKIFLGFLINEDYLNEEDTNNYIINLF
jgi:hypothetical protein